MESAGEGEGRSSSSSRRLLVLTAVRAGACAARVSGKCERLMPHTTLSMVQLSVFECSAMGRTEGGIRREGGRDKEGGMEVEMY